MPERDLCELWLADKDEIRRYGERNQLTEQSESSVLVQSLLSRHIEGFSSVMLKKNEHGKPYVAGLPISYNLSHSGSVYAMIICSAGECGIDVQVVKERKKYEDALRSVFTDKEYDKLMEKGTDTDFFQLWSLKEAYVKAFGGSIWYGRDFDSETEPGCYSDNWFKREGFWFYSTETRPGLYLTIAMSEKPNKMEFMIFPSKDFS